MRFIHTADIHLGMVPDAGQPWSEARRNEIMDAFRYIIMTCRDQKADLLLIAGDLFHRPPLLRELKEADALFASLEHTRVVIAAGNHDYMGPGSRYAEYSFKSPVVLLGPGMPQSVYFKELNTRVYGFSYEQRNIKEDRINKISPMNSGEIHILLAHGGEPDYCPVNWEQLKQGGFDYAALGHIHKSQKITERIIYPGSPEPLDKNETGVHGFTAGEIEKDGTVSRIRTWFVPCAVRQYIALNVEVTPEMTNMELEDRISSMQEAAGRNHIYKIRLAGYRSDDMVPDIRRLKRLGNVIEVKDETIPDYDFEYLYRENKDNIIGLYIDRIRRAGYSDEIADKALYYGIGALLHKGTEA